MDPEVRRSGHNHQRQGPTIHIFTVGRSLFPPLHQTHPDEVNTPTGEVEATETIEPSDETGGPGVVEPSEEIGQFEALDLFGNKEVSYLGFTLTPEGIKPGKNKLKRSLNISRAFNGQIVHFK